MTKKLIYAQNKFLGKCPICGRPLKKMKDVNILRCTNQVCPGVTRHKQGESFQEPYYRILDDKGMRIYNHLFKNNL